MDTKQNSVIPLVVGVTGHRDLRAQDIPALEAAVKRQLQQLQQQLPLSPIHMLNAQAAGGDQLCARVALSLQIPLYCPLPMEEAEYCKDFTADELTQYRALRNAAAEVCVAPHIEPERPERDYLYRQAGIYVAANCHVLLALWDGTPGKPDGCGTAEAVDFMRKGSYRGAPLFLPANDGAVIHIATPRASKGQSFPVTETLLENERGALHTVLSQTERYNRDVCRIKPDGGWPLLAEEYLQAPIISRLHAVYLAADQLSLYWQKRYLRIIGALSAFSVLLALFYLLYGSVGNYAFLMGYSAVMLLYILFYRFIARRQQHDKYLQYRTLAEVLRVQLYLHAIGVEGCVCDDFTWTQKHDATWVKEAVCALLIGAPEEAGVSPDEVKAVWIDGQRDYHAKAGKRDGKNHRTKERTTGAMLKGIVVLWLVVLVMATLFRTALETAVLGLALRSWFDILWGCLSVVTVFVAGYYGKLSLERKSDDHEKMHEFFAMASQRYDSDPDSRTELFRLLAREELIENGNWVSYCRENKPDFSV